MAGFESGFRDGLEQRMEPGQTIWKGSRDRTAGLAAGVATKPTAPGWRYTCTCMYTSRGQVVVEAWNGNLDAIIDVRTVTAT